MKYDVLNLPRRTALGDGICSGYTFPSGAAAILASQAIWGPIKSWKTALDTNQQPLLGVFNQVDATEFADLYTYVLANEGVIDAHRVRFSQPWTNPATCVLGGENALINEWGTKVARLKALMDKATGQASGGSGTTGTGTRVVVIYPGGAGQQQTSQQPPQTTPEPEAATEAAAKEADASAKKKELTKNILIGGGILAAIGTGIWALVKK